VEDAARELIHDYLERHELAVLATASPSGSPAAALIGIAFMGKNNGQGMAVVFDTLTSTRKYARLKANPRVALVIGLGEETTLQLDGEAEELAGEALAEAKEIYFRKWPDGREREAWPNITYFKVRPSWIRHSDFGRQPPRIIELGIVELGRAEIDGAL
jgi:general stress protein 26